jgi:hypothetical protein
MKGDGPSSALVNRPKAGLPASYHNFASIILFTRKISKYTQKFLQLLGEILTKLKFEWTKFDNVKFDNMSGGSLVNK